MKINKITREDYLFSKNLDLKEKIEELEKKVKIYEWFLQIFWNELKRKYEILREVQDGKSRKL